jgi:hypothetical protein
MIPPNAEDEEFHILAKAIYPCRESDNRTCILCAGTGDGTPAEHGRLLNAGVDTWIHVNCALWSADVTEDWFGTLLHVPQAIERGKQLRCNLCGDRGATVGCHIGSCDRVYHFHCALSSGCGLYTNREVLCAVHCKEKKSGTRVTDFRSLRNLSILAVEGTLKQAQRSAACVRTGALTVVSAG